MRTEISVFLRTADGPFQQLLMQQNARGHSLAFYEMLHGMAARDPFTIKAVPRPYVRTVGEINSPVCLFLNRPFTSVNAFFIETLFQEASKEECGIVAGIAVNLRRQVIGTSEVFDTASLFETARSAHEIAVTPSAFFAVRRELLAAAGGLSLLSPSDMQPAATYLSEEAKRQRLRVLQTPWAVATTL